MAVARETNETYFCETDSDREGITCYAGQKCIMANGDIYICITEGTWLKVGGDE